MAAVVLDVNETLLDLRGLEPTFDAMGLPGAMPLWFSHTLRNGFALAASGDCRPFAEVATDALIGLSPSRLTRRDGEALLDAFGRLEPHPDVEPGLRELADAGIPAMTLTIGDADLVAGIMDRSGLGDLFAGHLSAGDIGRWKPAPAPYLAACLALDLPPAEVTMVAAHAWDLHGAHRAGLRTAFLSRVHGPRSEIFAAPDLVAPDLPALVAQIIGSPTL